MKYIDCVILLLYIFERLCFYYPFDYKNIPKEKLYNVISMNHIHHLNILLSSECIKDITNFGYICDIVISLFIVFGLLSKGIHLLLFFDFVLRFSIIIKYMKKLGMDNLIYSFPILNIFYFLVFIASIALELNVNKNETKIVEAQIIKCDITKIINERRRGSITLSKRRKRTN